MYIYFRSLRAKRHLLIGLALLLMLSLTACGKKAPEDLYKSAEQAIQRGDLITAMTNCNKIIKDSPDTEVAQEARWLLAGAYMRNNNREKALALLDEILKRGGVTSPKGKDALIARHQIWREDKQYDKIIADIEATSASLKSEPLFSWGMQFFLAQIYQDKKENAKALDILEKLQASVKDDEQKYLRTLQQRAVILALDKKYEEALSLYEVFLKEHPKTEYDYACMLNMGGLRMLQSESIEDAEKKETAKDQGTEIYLKAVDIMTKDMEAELVKSKKAQMAQEIAMVYHQRLNDTPKAIDTLTSTVASFQNETNEDTLMLMGRVAELNLAIDNFEQARIWFQKIATDYSSDANVYQAAEAMIAQVAQMEETAATSRTLAANLTSSTLTNNLTSSTLINNLTTASLEMMTTPTLSLPVADATTSETKTE